jgi:hypothetical protein
MRLEVRDGEAEEASERCTIANFHRPGPEAVTGEVSFDPRNKTVAFFS